MSKLGPGSLLLGSDKGALPYGSERPRHEVRISERWIGTELVTRGVWAEAMDEECESEENEPVENKSWEQIAHILRDFESIKQFALVTRVGEEKALKLLAIFNV